MNRQHKIVKAILEALYNQDGNTVPELVLHAEVNLRVTPNTLLSEFESGLREGESLGWILGVRTKLLGVKWSLTDNGKAAFLGLSK